MLLMALMALIWYVPFPLSLLLLIQVIRLRAYKTFPWFCVYVIYDIVAGVVRIATSQTHIYFFAYWATVVGYDLLALAIIYEVYRSVFLGLTHAWRFRLIFPMTLVSVAALLGAHILFAPVQGSHSLFKIIVTTELGMELLQGLTFVVLVACVAILGLRWRQYAFGITAGFGFYGTITLAATTKFSVFVTSSIIVHDYIDLAAYSGSVLIWLWYFRKPQEPEPSGVSEEFIQKARSELELYRKLIRRARDL